MGTRTGEQIWKTKNRELQRTRERAATPATNECPQFAEGHAAGSGRLGKQYRKSLATRNMWI